MLDVSRTARLILTVNGPGELAGWAYPLAAALKEADSRVAVGVALLPCVFATGAEAAVASCQEAIDAISTPEQTMRWMLRGVAPPGFDGAARTIVVHLGGEPLLTHLLARRLRCRCAAYVEGPVSWLRRFDHVFSRDAAVAGRLPCQSTPVGDLAVDAARRKCPARRPRRAGEAPTVGLFPGSRRVFYEHMLPFFLRVASLASPRLPGARWMVGRAAFVSDDDLAAAAASPPRAIIEGDAARWESDRDGPALVVDGGPRVGLGASGDVMARATIVLTLPGTSTAELAALGIPMVVCGPTYRLYDVPMPGLLGHVGRLPAVGPALKHVATHIYTSRMPFFAHPNRRAGRMVVPEVIGRITAADVADTLVTTLSAPTDALERTLMETMGPPGAADRLARALLDELVSEWAR